VVLSLYNEFLDEKVSDDLADKILMPGIKKTDLAAFKQPTGMDLAKLAIQYADGIIAGVPELHPELAAAVAQRKLPLLPYCPISTQDTRYIQAYNKFYDEVISANGKSK